MRYFMFPHCRAAVDFFSDSDRRRARGSGMCKNGASNPRGSSTTAATNNKPSTSNQYWPNVSDNTFSTDFTANAPIKAASRTVLPPIATQIRTSVASAKPKIAGETKANCTAKSAPANPATAPEIANAAALYSAVSKPGKPRVSRCRGCHATPCQRPSAPA